MLWPVPKEFGSRADNLNGSGREIARSGPGRRAGWDRAPVGMKTTRSDAMTPSRTLASIAMVLTLRSRRIRTESRFLWGDMNPMRIAPSLILDASSGVIG